MYYVYMIKNKKGDLYVGSSDDPTRRLKEHNSKQGAVFTKRGNFDIVFKEKYSSLKEATERERQLKRWRRQKKEILIKKFGDGQDTKMNI